MKVAVVSYVVAFALVYLAVMRLPWAFEPVQALLVLIAVPFFTVAVFGTLVAIRVRRSRLQQPST